MFRYLLQCIFAIGCTVMMVLYLTGVLTPDPEVTAWLVWLALALLWGHIVVSRE